MSWKKSTIGDILSIVKNGINCKQNKIPIGEKITRIETIAKKFFDYQRVGYASLTKDEKRRNKLKVGDILFSHINSPIHVGKTAIYKGEEDIYHGINLLLMRTISEVNPYFFNLYLNHLFLTGYWENNCKKSVNQASVNQKDISKIVFNYPPLPIQQKIVDKLDAIFAEIDKAKDMAEANVKNAEALFQSYLKQIFDYKREHWETVRLGDILETSAGGTPLKSIKKYYEGGDIPWLMSGEVCSKEIFTSLHKITKLGVENSSAKLFPTNTTLIAMYGATAGQVGILRFPATTNQAVCGIMPNKNYLPEFLYYYLSFYKKTLLLEVSGVAQPNLSQIKIKNIPIPKISLGIQQKMLAKLDEISAQVSNLNQLWKDKVNNLTFLQQSILKQAFNGELIKAA